MINYINAITSKFGSKYIESGNEIRYDCPFCYERRGKEDKDSKLYVSLENGCFFCFKCGAKGRVFVKKQEQDIDEKLKNILSQYLDNDFDDEEDNTFYVPNIKLQNDSVAYNYCISRGITEDKIKYYDLRLGINELFGRIVIPNQVYTDKGVWTDMYSARSYLNQVPKYKNPSGAKKTNAVFNLHRIKDNAERIIIVEGAITSICAGKDAVAIYGCHPSVEQVSAIINKNPQSIYCVLDGDEAGTKGNKELLSMLSEHYDGTIYYVAMSNGIDACDMGEIKFNEYVNAHKRIYTGSILDKILYDFA